jgi:hypothetical protein
MRTVILATSFLFAACLMGCGMSTTPPVRGPADFAAHQVPAGTVEVDFIHVRAIVLGVRHGDRGFLGREVMPAHGLPLRRR